MRPKTKRHEQLPLLPNHPPDVLARANREAAETALKNPFYTERERLKLAAHYTALAEQYERTA